MRRYFSISLLFLIIGFTICEASQISIRIKPLDQMVTIPSVEVKGSSPLVSLPVLCEKMGYTCQWNRYLQELTCIKKGSQIGFIQDNPFYRVNGVIYQASSAPVRVGGSLYLPFAIVKNIPPFSNKLQLDTVEKNVHLTGSGDKNLIADTGDKKKNIGTEEKNQITIYDSKYSIVSASVEKKQNGTLLSITLSDSLPFDCTYFYPNLTINFLGGTIDTQRVKQTTRIGLVDSLFALQYKQSAQVSLILIREIEEPVIDYIQDSRTLLIALRQKKIKAVAPKKPANSSAVIENEPNSEGLKRIVLDPGHGGKDPGAIGITGIKEKDVVLSIALKVRDMLKKQNRLKVLLTRERDIFIPLSERTKFANDKKADLFISVHADAVPGNKKRKENTRGYKIYFLSQAKNEEDKLVAMRENAVIELEDRPQNYSNLHNVLIDLAGNEFLKESQDLCILLDQKFESTTGNKIPKLHLGVGQANFWVLNGAYMPSILVEAGFLSNPSEEQLLTDPKFQNQIAAAIYKAITGFKEKYETGL